MSLEKYLQQKIWQPYGMEADGNWWSANGVSFGGSGLSATLRDYGRFGLFIMNNGVLANGTKVLPDNWVKDAITWSSASASPEYADNGQYGYMWWFNPAYDNGLAPSPVTLNMAAPLQDTDAAGGAVRVQAQPASVADWTFAALGIYGQMIAINQREKLVVVQWATWDKTDPTCCDTASASYNARDPYNEEAVFLNALIKALH
jgi:CubicO group peptidase (beta-lactamase class C family)